jgi:hypothetical protein
VCVEDGEGDELNSQCNSRLKYIISISISIIFKTYSNGCKATRTNIIIYYLCIEYVMEHDALNTPKLDTTDIFICYVSVLDTCTI